MTRRIPFEGIDNFRDFGGYAAGGRRMRQGLLYRSAHQARATDEDLAKLADLGVTVIVDLRRANERERDVSRRYPGFAGEVIQNDIDQQDADAWADFIAGADLSAESMRDFMVTYYRNAPYERRHLDLYRRYFQRLADADGAVLVHCTAGKDRTGIICALTHHLAGVHDDDILEDYLLTNDHERMVARLPLMRENVAAATGGRVPTDEALMTAMGVKPEYLAEAFRVMREQHGSLDGYLEAALGMDDALRGRIHDRLLA